MLRQLLAARRLCKLMDTYSRVVVDNFTRERRTLSKHACRSDLSLRRHRDLHTDTHRSDLRPPFSYDASQIMHSHAYARYIDKTQAFYLFENDHITHRVLHVQMVSKIGRVIGHCLRLNEDLIEAIALGHDLGHVPYGHEGERILNRLCVEDGIGGFFMVRRASGFSSTLRTTGKVLTLRCRSSTASSVTTASCCRMDMPLTGPSAGNSS